MSRIRFVTAVSVALALALALAGIASAAQTKVTGGTAQITASSAAAQTLAANHITVQPLAPATQSGATLTLPISGGHIDTANLHGIIRMKGGLALSNGTQSVEFRRAVLVSNNHGASLWAFVRGNAHRSCTAVGARHHHAHVRCTRVTRWHTARIARLTDAQVSGNTASATALLTAASAKAVNDLAGKQVVKAGDVLGTASISPTFS